MEALVVSGSETFPNLNRRTARFFYFVLDESTKDLPDLTGRRLNSLRGAPRALANAL